MEVQLKSALETIDGFNVTMEKKDEEIWIFVEQNKIMSNKKNEIQQQLYTLSKRVQSVLILLLMIWIMAGPWKTLLEFLDTFQQLSALFLEALNYSEACDADDGDWCARI